MHQSQAQGLGLQDQGQGLDASRPRPKTWIARPRPRTCCIKAKAKDLDCKAKDLMHQGQGQGLGLQGQGQGLTSLGALALTSFLCHFLLFSDAFLRATGKKSDPFQLLQRCGLRSTSCIRKPRLFPLFMRCRDRMSRKLLYNEFDGIFRRWNKEAVTFLCEQGTVAPRIFTDR